MCPGRGIQITKVVPQGILLSIFIKDFGKDTQANLHLYVDDTIICTSAPSAAQVIGKLQTANQSLQRSLIGLIVQSNFFTIKILSYSTLIERVSSYEYLGIWIDKMLSFYKHISNLVKKLKLAFILEISNVSHFLHFWKPPLYLSLTMTTYYTCMRPPLL